VGRFTKDFYWSSTEDDNGYQGDAMGRYFDIETRYKDSDYNKQSRNHVRPIRAF
jgi:hypothetical protein